MNKNTPITQAALEQLEFRKKALEQYSGELMSRFIEQIKSSLNRTLLEMMLRQEELMNLTTVADNSITQTLNPEEPTDDKTGNAKNDKHE